MIVCALLVALLNTVHGQPKNSVLSESGGSGLITGDGFQMNLDQQVVTYTGNVNVVQGESTLFCDKLDAYYEEFGKWKKIVATGNVRLVDGAFTATGSEGIFYPAEQKIELNGQAKVWQENNTITAHQIVAFVAQNIVEGYGADESERVVMTVYSQKNIAFPGQTQEPDSAESSQKTEQSVSPTVIISNTLRYASEEQQAVFTGNVVATKEKDEMKSDEMVVFLTQTEQEENDVDRLELYGNVNIIHETYLILGETGIYYKNEDYAEVIGTKQSFARIVDTTDNVTRIQAYGIRYDLGNNLVESIALPKETQSNGSSRVRTEFETEQGKSLLNPGKPTPTPTPEPQLDREELPSVTLYPDKAQQKTE